MKLIIVGPALVTEAGRLEPTALSDGTSNLSLPGILCLLKTKGDRQKDALKLRLVRSEFTFTWHRL